MSVTINQDVIDALKQRIHKGVRKGCDQALVTGIGYAQSLVLVDTSNLQGSIPENSEVIDNGDSFTIKLGAEAFSKNDYNYALANEYGTSKWAGKPFLRPAAHQLAAELPGIIEQNLKG